MYYPVPMHIHSVWERHASMEGHFYNAQKLGIKHMYITDHDTRMGRKQFHIDSFDFSKGVLRIDEPSTDPFRPKDYGFTVTREDEGCSAFMTENNELCLLTNSSSNDWSAVSVTFDSSQNRQDYALLAKVLLHLGMSVSKTDEDTRIIVDVNLSQRPPEFKTGHILYVFGNADGLEDEYSAVKHLKPQDELYVLNLLQDAEKVGGGDNVLQTVTFTVCARNGKSAKLLLNHFKITWELSFEDARVAQRKLAEEIGKKYGVTPIVSTEITGAGQHKICFSTNVPIIDYEAMNYNVSHEYAINHVLSHGGIFALNHPFDIVNAKVSRQLMPKEEGFNEVLDEYLNAKGYGAALMEVGFTMGRGEYSLDDHLLLWDIMSADGIFITGYGDSDNHTNDAKWFDGNNFVGYIFADTPCEENFITAMKGGNLYTGDPVYLQNMKIHFTDEQKNPMGSVVFTDKTAKVSLSVDGGKGEMQVVWTVNGDAVKVESFTGKYEGFAEVSTDKMVNFVRAAIYKDGRCIMLTNPIYYTSDKTLFDKVCEERRRIID